MDIRNYPKNISSGDDDDEDDDDNNNYNDNYNLNDDEDDDDNEEERFNVFNNVNSLSMNNIITSIYDNDNDEDDDNNIEIIHQRRSSLPNELNITNNNNKTNKNDDKKNNKNNNKLQQKINNNQQNNKKKRRDHSAPVVKFNSNNNNNNNERQKNNLILNKSPSYDRIDHSAPNFNNNNNNHNEKEENSKRDLFADESSKFLLKSESNFDFKEISEHFLRKNEQEIGNLRIENENLKILVNNLKKSSTMPRNDNEQALKTQIKNLQEELLRVKLQLDQSQCLRINEFKKHRSTENINNTKSTISSHNNSNCVPSNNKQTLEQNANLLSEISRLKASESILKENLEEERNKINKLNEKITELTKIIHEFELNENGVNAALTSNTNPSKVILTNSNNQKLKIEVNRGFSSQLKNEALYYEILEKLKSQGFDNTSNYKDIVIALYQQRNNTVKQLTELLYYMKQLNINCNEPVQGIKKLFDDIKSYKNEIQHLNNKIESLKLEMQYQQNEYTKQIKYLLEEKDNLLSTIKRPTSNHSNYVYVNGINSGNNGESLKIMYNINNENKNNNDSNDDSSINANEIQQFDNSYNDDSDNCLNRQSYRSSVQVITTKTYAIPYDNNNNNSNNNDDDYINDDTEPNEERNTKITVKKNEKMNRSNTPSIRSSADKSNKNEMKHQIAMLENEIKETVEKNNLLIEQYEKNVQYLNEQIKFFKNEMEQQKKEFNDSRQKLKLKNAELKRKIEEYEKEINETTKQFNKDQIEIERLKLDIIFKQDENKKLQNDLRDFADTKMKCNQLEEKLSLEVRNSQYLQNKILQLEQELLNQTRNSNKQEDLVANNDRIIENLKEVIKEQMFAKTTSVIDTEEFKLKIHELQMKLAHEKLIKDSLEIKLKLVEQDNQNLRQTLLNNSRKFASRNEKDAKSRIDEINELIEKAQINAQNLIASNPNLANLLESKS